MGSSWQEQWEAVPSSQFLGPRDLVMLSQRPSHGAWERMGAGEMTGTVQLVTVCVHGLVVYLITSIRCEVTSRYQYLEELQTV